VSATGDRRLPARFTLPVTGFILSGIMTIMISNRVGGAADCAADRRAHCRIAVRG
jgi:hypothetical protein